MLPLCVGHWFLAVLCWQVMTQRIIGSPRKRGHEDLHLQSCGALSSSPSPSMRRPKHLPQTTSTCTNPLSSPSSEQSLECRETILWPLSQRGLGSKLWGQFQDAGVADTLSWASDVCGAFMNSSCIVRLSLERCDCSAKLLKCCHTVFPSALWDCAKSSAEMVANSDWACQCL